MTGVRRIQRRRVRGWRKPAGAVIIDRTSRWGNPFTVADAIAQGRAANEEQARVVVTDRFRQWLRGDVAGDPDVIRSGKRTFDRRWMLAHLDDIRGRVLCCPCAVDQVCHGDDLWTLANQAAGAAALREQVGRSGTQTR